MAWDGSSGGDLETVRPATKGWESKEKCIKAFAERVGEGRGGKTWESALHSVTGYWPPSRISFRR